MRAQGRGLPVELRSRDVRVGRQKLIALLMGLTFRLSHFRTLELKSFISFGPFLVRREESQVSGKFFL